MIPGTKEAYRPRSLSVFEQKLAHLPLADARLSVALPHFLVLPAVVRIEPVHLHGQQAHIRIGDGIVKVQAVVLVALHRSRVPHPPKVIGRREAGDGDEFEVAVVGVVVERRHCLRSGKFPIQIVQARVVVKVLVIASAMVEVTVYNTKSTN